MITEQQIVVRLMVTGLLSGLIGFEREKHQQPAGLRTHIILSIGACLAMCISIDLSMQFRQWVPNGDPARLAAQVISGIGFLGAGAILRYGTSVKGLTTAASLWTVAIIGLAVGAGHFFSAAATTAFMLGALVILDQVEKRYLGTLVLRTVSIRAKDRAGLVDEVKQLLQERGIELKAISLGKNLEHNEIEIEAAVKIPPHENVDKIFFALSSIKDTRSIEVH